MFPSHLKNDVARNSLIKFLPTPHQQGNMVVSVLEHHQPLLDI